MTPVETASGVWSAESTTPAEIEGALRKLLEDQHRQDASYAPARVLNLVAIVEREWRGEILNRLERVGRYHPSRTVLCAVGKGRDSLDAWATMACQVPGESGGISVCEERVEIDMGSSHLPHLETIVDPLIVPDLSTLVWAPHGHSEAVDALLGIADVVMLDSVEEPEPRGAIRRAQKLLERAYVVDLAWLRSMPWRERIAATFDPRQWRPALFELEAVTIRHRFDSGVSGLLLLGWLATRLGWRPGSFMEQNGSLVAIASTHRRDIRLRLEADVRQQVPGLSGLTLETSSGMSLSLDRGPGGLAATRRLRDGSESSWVVLGASRGEAGILGEGIRQALLRDPTYGPSLDAAAEMLGA
jgi:glucose-6-phosphate dehydrogenase assembly protein OpcA